MKRIVLIFTVLALTFLSSCTMVSEDLNEPLHTDTPEYIFERRQTDAVVPIDVSFSGEKDKPAAELFEIMDSNRAKFGKILDDPEQYEVQALLTEIRRDDKGNLTFISSGYGVDRKMYFFPASVIKMAVAALTLQKLGQIEAADRKCLLSVAGYSANNSVEEYIKRMLRQSDNAAYNKLYDFLGQEYINDTLHEMGYPDCQIIRRFASDTSAAQDRTTSAVKLTRGSSVVYSQSSLTNKNALTLKGRDDISGLLRGHSRITSSGQKINSPKEFFDWNFMPIEDMQGILKSIVFPFSTEPSARFAISEDDRAFLLDCMRGEGTGKKYFIYGDQGEVDPKIEIYNKTGTGYGNILDNAYIVDKVNGIEFMLTAVIYVNPNGVLADDNYDYEKTGMPFLKDLGLAVYNYYLSQHSKPGTQNWAAKQEVRVSLIAVGDNMMHNSVIKWAKTADGYDFSPLYRNIVDTVKAADIAFVNQEAPLGGADIAPSGYPLFNSPQEVGLALAEAGFDVVNHANNHGVDKGAEAVIATANFWQGIDGVSCIGISTGEAERESITVIEKEGLKFAFLAYSYGTNGMPVKDPYLINLIDRDLIKADVQKAREISDAVIVSMHWGNEYELKPSAEQRGLAQYLADLNVTLVIGHHPHVIQPVEWIYGKDGNKTLVAFSLGNFISSQDKTETMLGGMLTLTFTGNADGVAISKPAVIPLMTHYDKSYKNYCVYRLNDYPAELESRHFLSGVKKSFSIDYLRRLSQDVLGDFCALD